MSHTIDIDKIIRGATVATDPAELAARLAEGRPLRVKYGIDPTSPHVHFGHTVPLRMLRRFQEAGHEAHLIIGDFTASIGDPSGRNESRPPLTPDQITENKKTYLEQIGKFLDMSRVKVWHNSTWMFSMSVRKLIEEFAAITLQRMLDRKDFATRVAHHTPVFLHELIYPVVQGIDSRQIEADVELGGTEQLYTLLLARDIQQRAGQKPQTCITVPILRGTDGNKRMGKSLNNFIGVSEPPKEIFGKTMSIPDDLIDEWLDLLTDLHTTAHSPYHRKLSLAELLTAQCHGQEIAENTRVQWLKQFSEGADPDEITEIEIPNTDTGTMEICHLLVVLGLCSSNSEARRLIVPTSGVTIGTDRQKITNPKQHIPLETGLVVRVGKRRIAKIRVN